MNYLKKKKSIYNCLEYYRFKEGNISINSKKTDYEKIFSDKMASKRQLPHDLLIVAGLVLLTDILVLVPVFSGSFLRTYLGIFLVLFLPGYALTGAIFPAKNDLEGIERAVVSFGLSIAIVPIAGFALNYTAWGVREIPVLTILSDFTLLMCAIAYYRRGLLSEGEAFEIPIKASFLNIKNEILEKPESTTDRVLAILLILLVLASVGSLAYIIGVPKEEEHFTEFYLLGPNGTADYYPTTFAMGENVSFIVGIRNHEHRPVNYTMEVKLGNNSLPLPENQKYINLADNMSWEKPITFTPLFEGNNTKVEFLLYNESERTVPYRNLHIGINVTKET
jgi:uncharacterized membrane protein